MPRRPEKLTREGAVLRKFRNRLGLTEKQVADRAGVTREMVCLWECGRESLSRDRLVEVLGSVDIPPEAVDAALLSDDLAFPPQSLSLPTEPSRERSALIHQTAAAAGGRTTRATRVELLADSHHEAAREHRAWAAKQWSLLVKSRAETQERSIEALLGGRRS